MRSRSLPAILLLTFFQIFWLWMIARQYGFLLVSGVLVTLVLVVGLMSRKVLAKFGLLAHILVGAAAGYLAAVAAAAVAECNLRGYECLNRDFTANLYFFPLISLGWAYGAICFGILAWSFRRAIPSSFAREKGPGSH